MKKIVSLTLFAVVAFFTGQAQNVTINGRLQMKDPVNMVYLNYTGDGINLVDSSKPEKGKFSFLREVEYPTWAFITVKYEPTATEKKARTERLQLFMEPGKMTIKAKDSLKFAKVKGSKSHNFFVEYIKLKTPFDESSRTLNSQFQKFKKENDEAGMKRIKEELELVSAEKEEKLLRNYFTSHPNSPLAFYILDVFFSFGNMNVVKAEPAFEILDPSLQLSERGLAFKNRLESLKQTNVGATAINFTQNDTLGNPVSLADFKGKYVLLDFWASWCVPCRAENPNIVKAFRTYKDKGFTVLGVALERPDDKQLWMDAIHKDQLTWTQVSDFKFWNNDVAKLYGIAAVPQNFLIDPNGKIIAKNIKGEELEKMLTELFVN